MHIVRSENSKFKTLEEKRNLLLQYSKRVLRGDRQKDILEELMQTLNFDYFQAINFYNEVRDLIAEINGENNEKVLHIHVELYEEIYKRFNDLDHSKGKLKTLEQKEKLLNLYQEEEREIVINNQTNIIQQDNYDTTKLNSNQQSRLFFLLEKAKS